MVQAQAMDIRVFIVEFVHICGEVLQMIQRTKSHVNKPPTLGASLPRGICVFSLITGELLMFTYNC